MAPGITMLVIVLIHNCTICIIKSRDFWRNTVGYLWRHIYLRETNKHSNVHTTVKWQYCTQLVSSMSKARTLTNVVVSVNARVFVYLKFCTLILKHVYIKWRPLLETFSSMYDHLYILFFILYNSNGKASSTICNI